MGEKSRIKAERRTNNQLSDREERAQIAEEVRRWRRRAAYLGVGLIVSVLAVDAILQGRAVTPLLEFFWSYVCGAFDDLLSPLPVLCCNDGESLAVWREAAED